MEKRITRIEISVTEETKHLLDIYETEKLLSTIPEDYVINQTGLETYAEKAKLLPSTVLVSLSENTFTRISAIADNYKAPIDLILNFLIECIANCGKIQTKKVTRALNNYYKLIINHNNPEYKELLSKVLESYAQSGFYDEEIGLSEQSIADFLTISKERKRFSK